MRAPLQDRSTTLGTEVRTVEEESALCALAEGHSGGEYNATVTLRHAATKSAPPESRVQTSPYTSLQ